MALENKMGSPKLSSFTLSSQRPQAGGDAERHEISFSERSEEETPLNPYFPVLPGFPISHHCWARSYFLRFIYDALR